MSRDKRDNTQRNGNYLQSHSDATSAVSTSKGAFSHDPTKSTKRRRPRVPSVIDESQDPDQLLAGRPSQRIEKHRHYCHSCRQHGQRQLDKQSRPSAAQENGHKSQSPSVTKSRRLRDKPVKYGRFDQKAVNKLLLFCNTSSAVAAALAVTQYTIRLIHMRYPGVNLDLGRRGTGAFLDIAKVASTISDFRNVTSIGKIVGVYTAAKWRRDKAKARIAQGQRQDRFARSIDFVQLAAVMISLTGKGLGWACRRNILKLSRDKTRHESLMTNWIDRPAARIWMGSMGLDFLTLGRDLYRDRQVRHRQKQRLRTGEIDKKNDAAVVACNTPEAIEARRQKIRWLVTNILYLPVAIGYSFENSPVSWRGITIWNLIAQSFRCRGYFVDALRTARKL